MPTDALRNPLVLPILGLLVEAPRHPYAVFSELRDRYGYLRIRNATVYTLLNRLTEAGWVEPAEEGNDAALTPTKAGTEALAERVTRQIREAGYADGSTFATALAYIGILPAERARELLEERAAEIRAEIERLSQALASTDVPELHMIEVEYLLSSLRQDAAWLTETVRRISEGELSWP